MAYPHDAFTFPMDQQAHAAMYFSQPVAYPAFVPQQQPHPDVMYQHNPFSEYGDFLPPGMMFEDYEEGTEISTRPRLTKEQVEVLESQFQAHPKPNSMVKKQLAMQTKLTLPRVANWFQNRRAKAKQQRKQEEFEASQSVGASLGCASEGTSTPCMTDDSSKTASPGKRPGTAEAACELSDSRSPTKSSESPKSTSWASLQKAFGAHRNSHQQQIQDSDARAMPPPGLPRQNVSSGRYHKAPQLSGSIIVSPSLNWPHSQSLGGLDLSSPVETSASIQDMGFDFGFDQQSTVADHLNMAEDISGGIEQQCVDGTEDWSAGFPIHGQSNIQDNFVTADQSSPLPLPAYPESRRGSGSDELTANLGTFGIAGTSPLTAANLGQMANFSRGSEGEIDLASRRKRPRPAALTSASLRSRSYGAMSSQPPSFRSGPPSGNALRHVKSTGHNLNSHYAGIRKTSMPQKSPLNIATFAEADSIKELMAQQAAASAAAAAAKTPLTTPGTEMGGLSMAQEMASHLGVVDETSIMTLPSEMMAQYQQMHSPPHTPFQTEYMVQPTSASMPPRSARAQYATFADFTPPYSAGPLTNSTCSWSDAPLHSPDVTGFPPGHYLSALGFAQQHDPSFQQWILPSDNTTELSGRQGTGADDNKKLEFFIAEFPGQKEEYASIAQHVQQPKPKNYVFANTAPSDYDFQ